MLCSAVNPGKSTSLFLKKCFILGYKNSYIEHILVSTIAYRAAL